MKKITFETYVELLDKYMAKQGMGQKERDEMFNHPDNADIISTEFGKNTHPSVVVKMLDKDPVYTLHSKVDEKRKSKKAKENKFKRVMGEFGKGQLKPYHADRALRSKKQGGTEKERKQALAIAYSEAGLSEAKEVPRLSEENSRVVEFLEENGLEFVSTPIQIKNGTLEFYTPYGIYAIFTQSGYIRKWGYDRWGVLFFDDSLEMRPMELAEVLLEKYKRAARRDQKKMNKRKEEDFLSGWDAEMEEKSRVPNKKVKANRPRWMQ